jgi:hypothetical protein
MTVPATIRSIARTRHCLFITPPVPQFAGRRRPVLDRRNAPELLTLVLIAAGKSRIRRNTLCGVAPLACRARRHAAASRRRRAPSTRRLIDTPHPRIDGPNQQPSDFFIRLCPPLLRDGIVGVRVALELVAPDPEAARASVVPLDKDLESVGVPDRPATPETAARLLDSLALPWDV